MRILHIIISLDPRLGGPPVIAAQLAASQAQQGHDVTIVSTEDPVEHDRIVKGLEEITGFDKVAAVTLPRPGLAERICAFKARRCLEPLVQSADVVHIHAVWESILRIGAALARKHRKPYFVLLNGMIDPWAMSQKPIKKRVALALAYRRMLNGASALHVGTEYERETLRPLGITAPTFIIPNGLGVEVLDRLPTKGSFYAQHPELDGKPYVVFLSRLHYKKGLDYLADAFTLVSRRYADAHLVVVGPDDGERAKFEALVQQNGIDQRVHVIGPLYGIDRYAALVDAACYCLPSRQEGFSVAILEAMAAGTPVVISPECHFPEVSDAGAGEVVPLAVEAFADAMGGLLEDSKRAKQMGIAGSALIRAKYLWSNIARQTISMYERALAR